MQKNKHETGFEPATPALARRYSTTEPLVQLCCTCFLQARYIYYNINHDMSITFLKFFQFFVIINSVAVNNKSLLYSRTAF